MIHESIHQVSDMRRRSLANTMIARKVSGQEASGSSTLRQRLGNRGAQRLMSEINGHSKGSAQTRSPAIQAKLTVSQPGDMHEQEADRVANAVMRMPEPKVQRACARGGGSPSCPTEEPSKERARLQTKHIGSSEAGQITAPPLVHEVLASPGKPLDASPRAFFEPRFGHDFSHVRVHSGEAVEQSARDVNANAYTVGHNIVFGAGQFAPGTQAGRRLIAHELTHVVQQHRVAPFIQRDPKKKPDAPPPKPAEVTQPKSTDPVTDLNPVFRQGKEVWELTVRGYSDPATIGRMIWPPDQVPPSVSIKRIGFREGEVMLPNQGGNAPTEHRYWRREIFELTGVASSALKTMDPLFAKMFTDLGILEESSSIQAARAAFRARHNSLGGTTLDNIDTALKRVTRSNPGLLEAYYRFYSDWKLTDDKIESSSTVAGNTDRTIRRGGFTDINPGVLGLQNLPQLDTALPLYLLGETLMHEYAHTSHAGDYLKGPGEGKAYGIENFFAERLGDKPRDDKTLELGAKMGDKKAFDTAYFVMKKLYEVIDGRPSKIASLQGVSAQQAREMSVEFISKNKQDFGAELTNFILKELGQPAYNSLPSQETQ